MFLWLCSMPPAWHTEAFVSDGPNLTVMQDTAQTLCQHSLTCQPPEGQQRRSSMFASGSFLGDKVNLSSVLWGLLQRLVHLPTSVPELSYTLEFNRSTSLDKTALPAYSFSSLLQIFPKCCLLHEVFLYLLQTPQLFFLTLHIPAHFLLLATLTAAKSACLTLTVTSSAARGVHSMREMQKPIQVLTVTQWLPGHGKLQFSLKHSQYRAQFQFFWWNQLV